MLDDFLHFGVALCIGLLVGIQRESSFEESTARSFAGVRTFGLIAVSGYAASLISTQLNSAMPFLAVIAVLGGLLALSYHRDVSAGKLGMTTELAVIVTFVTGAMCYWDYLPLAAALGVMMTILLSMKSEFRSLSRAVTRDDILATLKFAVISLIILPILPNQVYGPAPFNVLNPHKIWLMVVFISGINFLAYLLIKVAGVKRGIGITGILGGFASSTALTMSMTRRSRTDDPSLTRPLAIAIITAWLIMYARVIVIAYVLSPPRAAKLILPFAIATIGGLIYAVALYLSQRTMANDTYVYKNPFEIKPAIRFGLLYALVLVITNTVQSAFGSTGLYIASFASGLVEVNAIILSVVDLIATPSEITITIAARAIVLAATANTIFKAIYATAAGSGQLKLALAPGVGLMVASGAVAVLLVK